MSAKSTLNTLVQKVLQKIPYIKQLDNFKKSYTANSCYPPGFYSSPIVNVALLKEREQDIWKAGIPETLPGIALNVDGQKALATAFSSIYKTLNFSASKTPGLRYWYENMFYSYTDAIILSCMIRSLKPYKIIEVGSGFSSAVMLDTLDAMKYQTTKLIFIEPYPERLNSILQTGDKERVAIVEKDVQQVGLEIFASLQDNDILFIDSSHVSKTGSDLNYLLFEVLPILKTGVVIHFHDIFYPFEYPKDWVLGGRNWNENYLIRAFLMHNSSYEIMFFSHFMHLTRSDVFKDMPKCYLNKGGNLWLKKL